MNKHCAVHSLLPTSAAENKHVKEKASEKWLKQNKYKYQIKLIMTIGYRMNTQTNNTNKPKINGQEKGIETEMKRASYYRLAVSKL